MLAGQRNPATVHSLPFRLFARASLARAAFGVAIASMRVVLSCWQQDQGSMLRTHAAASRHVCSSDFNASRLSATA